MSIKWLVRILPILFARVVTLGGATLLALVMARKFGLELFGLYTVALLVVTFFSLVARGGLDIAYMREHSREYRKSSGVGSPSDRLTRFVVSKILKRSLMATICLFALSSVAYILGIEVNRSYVIMLMCPHVFLLAGISLAYEYYKSIEMPVLAMLSNAGTASLLSALIFIVDGLYLRSVERDIQWIVLVSILCHTLILSTFCFPIASKYLKSRVGVSDSGGALTASMMAVVSARHSYFHANLYTYLSFSGLFLLAGVLFSDQEIGALRLAERLTAPAAVVLTIINPIISARLSIYFGNGNLAQLRTLTKSVTHLCILISMLYVATLVAFVLNFDLNIYFDTLFLSSHVLLFGIGQAVNLGAGPLGLVLAMSNGEDALKRISRFQAGFSLIVAGVLGGYLGPLWFSSIYSIGLCVKNCMMYKEVRRRGLL